MDLGLLPPNGAQVRACTNVQNSHAGTLRATGICQAGLRTSEWNVIDVLAPSPSHGHKVHSGCRVERRMRARLGYRCGGSVGLVARATAPTSRLTQGLPTSGHLTGRMVLPDASRVKALTAQRPLRITETMETSPELRAALAAAEAGARVIRECYQKNLAVTIKADKSPVTEADVRTEQAIRAVLAQHFPSYGFYGEETGRDERLDAPMWLVDPIDGTKAFVREYPMFSTQIALWRDGRLVLGVSSAPLYGELAYAERGSGSFLNGRRMCVSAVDAVEEAALSAGNLQSLARSSAWGAYGQLVARVSRIRGYGDFLHYHLLAAGKIDAVVESDVNILDIAALVTIVEEAGGRFTALDGAEVGLETTTVLASNGRLHGAIGAAIGFSR